MRIDLQGAIETVEELLEELQALDGVETDESPTRAARRQKAELTRTLLYLSHLGDKARVQVMDAYFDFKDQANPVE